jgi:hypothetical protein
MFALLTACLTEPGTVCLAPDTITAIAGIRATEGRQPDGSMFRPPILSTVIATAASLPGGLHAVGMKAGD